MVRKATAALLSALQLLWLVASPSAHSNTGAAAKIIEATLRSCNAGETKRLKALFRQVGELPRKNDAFGPSAKYVSEVSKLPTRPFIFYFYAFNMYGDNGRLMKGRDCTRPFVEFKPTSDQVEFSPNFHSIQKRDFFDSASFDAKALNTVRVHEETKEISPYTAQNAYGANVRVTGYVTDFYEFVMPDEKTSPVRSFMDVSASLNMTADEARALLPRLVVKLTLLPLFSDELGTSRIYLKGVRHQAPKITNPEDARFITHSMTGQLLELDIYDPSTSQVYLTLNDLLKPKPATKKATP